MPRAHPDARKQVWKFQEAVVVLALRRTGVPPTDIGWHDGGTPEGMSIEPDVIIRSCGAPRVIIFVTHASAERAGETKFWRTVAEAVEAKRLPTHPRILNVLFAGETKARLDALNERMFDGCIHLSKTAYGEKLTAVLASLAGRHGNDAPALCLQRLERLAEAGSIPGFNEFVQSVRLQLKARYGPFHAILSSPAFASNGRVPRARATGFRRGLAKLCTLPADVRSAFWDGRTVGRAPEHAALLGWCNKGVRGWYLTDLDIEWLRTHWPRHDAEELIARANSELPTFVEYAETLGETEQLSHANAWIVRHFGELATARGMADALERVFLSAKGCLEEISDDVGEVRRHWLLAGLISMLRTETGRADGYGYSKLGQEAGRERELNAFAGTIMAPYLQLRRNVDPDLRNDIARVLADHVARLGRADCERLLRESVITSVKSIFNYQITNYRHFHPLAWTVGRVLREASVPYVWPESHPSFLAEGDAVASSSRNLISVASGRVWIKSLSAYDGRIDKRKELCGRIGAMKLVYSAEDLARRAFLLVIDGYFDQDDVQLLVRAGWDGVYYPDEMGELLSHVRSSIQ